MYRSIQFHYNSFQFVLNTVMASFSNERSGDEDEAKTKSCVFREPDLSAVSPSSEPSPPSLLLYWMINFIVTLNQLEAIKT